MHSAAAFYQQAYDENPRSVEALVGLGRSYTGLGQYSPRAEQALLAARVAAAERPARCCSSSRATQLAAGDPAGGAAETSTRRRGKRPNDVRHPDGARHRARPA